MPIFSAQVTDLQDVGPIIDIRVAPSSAALDAMRKASQQLPVPYRVAALIDTGASHSVINHDVVTALNLTPVGQTSINTASCSAHPCYTYAVTFLMPTPDGGLLLPVRFETTVFGAPLAGQNIQCLLGRDFLKKGMLVYNGAKDTFNLAM